MTRADLIIAGSNFIFSHIKKNYSKYLNDKKKLFSDINVYIYTNNICIPITWTSIIIKYIEKSLNIELFDNKVNLITGYYKNTNGTGYVGLPRKYINLEDTGSAGPPSGQATNGAFLNQDNTTNGWINPAPSFRFVIKNDFYKILY